MDEVRRGTGHDRLNGIRARMKPAADLAWGETPWDDLPHEDLVFLLHSYHALASRAHAELREAGGYGRGDGYRNALAGLQAAGSSVLSDHLGPVHVHAAFGLRETASGMTEAESFERHVMAPVRDLLAFDVPRDGWWACARLGMMVGSRSDGTPSCLCRDSANPPPDGTCDAHRATWEDWRRQAPGGGDGV